MTPRIETNQIIMNLIGKDTPEEVKHNIFSRINQGSAILKAQEIRSVIFQGFRIQFVEKLASPKTEAGKSFLQATDNSVSTKRQDDLDFATRLLSFYLIDFENYEPDTNSFLTIGTKSIPKETALLERKESFKDDFVSKMQNDASFWAGITTGTATKDSVQKRHKLFKEFLNNHIQ